MARHLPSWESLGAKLPTSELEAEARILHLDKEIARIEEQLQNLLPPDKRNSAYRQWVVAANAAKNIKVHERRRLRIWLQEYQTRMRAAINLNKKEARVTQQIQTAQDSVPADLIEIGKALGFAAQAWGLLIRIVQAADDYVQAEDGGGLPDEVVDGYYDALRHLLVRARRRRLLSELLLPSLSLDTEVADVVA